MLGVNMYIKGGCCTTIIVSFVPCHLGLESVLLQPAGLTDNLHNGSDSIISVLEASLAQNSDMTFLGSGFEAITSI